MAETLPEQLADYRASWRVRVPADRQASMDQHVARLAAKGIDRSAKQVGDCGCHSLTRSAWRRFRHGGVQRFRPLARLG